MNEELEEMVWLIHQYLQDENLQQLKNEELIFLFQQAYSIYLVMQYVDTDPVEHQVMENIVKNLSDELSRRSINKLPFMPFEVAIDVDGTFLRGRENLAHMFKFLSFDEMMELIDAILANPLNEAQRKALLELAREKVFADAN